MGLIAYYRERERQPEHLTAPNTRGPYWRDGSILVTGRRLSADIGQAAAISGSPASGTTRNGVGPVVATGVVPSVTIGAATQFTLLVALRPSAVNGYQRVFSRSDTLVSMFGNISAGGIDLSVPHSGATGWWDINSGGFIASGDYVIAISYDGTSTSNDPLASVNGRRVSVSRFTAPSGTLSSTAGTLVLGNRADGQRAMGGPLPLFAWIPAAFGQAAIDSLTGNPWQLYEDEVIWVPVSAGGATLNASLIDAASSVDLSSASATLAGTLTDATAAIELITSTATRAASLQEAASAVDLCAAAATMLASLADAAAGSDVQSAALQGNASLLDAATAADIASTMATMAATLTDGTTAVDLLASTRIANAAAVEAAAAVDLVNSGSTVNAQVQEAASTADVLNAAATLVVQLIEAGNVLDQLAAAPAFVTLLTEAAQGSDVDSAAVPAVYSVTITELAAALDLLSGVIGGTATIDPATIRRFARSPALHRLARSLAQTRSTNGL